MDPSNTDRGADISVVHITGADLAEAISQAQLAERVVTGVVVVVLAVLVVWVVSRTVGAVATNRDVVLAFMREVIDQFKSDRAELTDVVREAGTRLTRLEHRVDDLERGQRVRARPKA